MELKEKTIIGLSWSFLDNFVGQGISFVVGIVLARLLSPAEFGILGIITFFVAISTSFIDSGFGSALIRKKDCSPTDCCTVFYFNLVVSLILYGLLFLLAPYAETFFDEPGLTSILRVAGVVLIINATGTIQHTLMVKKIDFKTKTKISITSDTLAGTIAIIMAYNGFGVWSLVWRSVLGQSFTTILLWVLNSWRPMSVFSLKSFKELFGFGYKLALSGLIDTTYRNIYYPIIQKVFSSTTLGFYTLAEKYTNLFSATLTTNIQRVSFPVLSTVQDDPDKMRWGYHKILRSTMMITFALMLGLAAVAKPMIVILIGESWLPCVPYLQLMCFSTMLYPMQAMNLNIITISGRSDLFLKLEIIKKTIYIPLIFIAIYFGVEALLIGMIINSIIAYFLNSYYSAKMIDYSSKSQLIDILPMFSVSLIVSLIVWSITFIGWNNWITIILQVVIATALTFGTYEIMKQENYLEMKEIVLRAFSRKRK